MGKTNVFHGTVFWSMGLAYIGLIIVGGYLLMNYRRRFFKDDPWAR
jgi:hypothetical protein